MHSGDCGERGTKFRMFLSVCKCIHIHTINVLLYDVASTSLSSGLVESQTRIFVHNLDRSRLIRVGIYLFVVNCTMWRRRLVKIAWLHYIFRFFVVACNIVIEWAQLER